MLQVSKQGQPVPAPRSAVPQETNFDVDGHVETVTQRPGGPHAMQARPHDRDMAQGRWVVVVGDKWVMVMGGWVVGDGWVGDGWVVVVGDG